MKAKKLGDGQTVIINLIKKAGIQTDLICPRKKKLKN